MVLSNGKPIIRKRVNGSSSVKGIVTWDVTVEVTAEADSTLLNSDYILNEHNELVRTMKEHYGSAIPDPTKVELPTGESS